MLPTIAAAYPLDGYVDTGIRRVEGSRLANEGVVKDRLSQVPGALLTTKEVDIRLLDHKDFQIPEADPQLNAQIKKLLGQHADEYGIAVLDLTDMEHPRYGVHRGDHKQNVGSVGKLLVGLGVFQAMADVWPDETKRLDVLKNTLVTADKISQYDHHTIRLFNPETKKLTRRSMKIGDQGSQWEFLDWMLSISSNSAAAMNQRQGMLMRQYGTDFPPSESEIARYFKETPSKEKTALYKQTFWEPVTRNGLDIEQFRQGSFFSRNGKFAVNGGGNSYATANQLLQFLVKMEQGELVDEFSSRQLKRLLYLTEHRIRYASSPALRKSAVYYKSGSWYKCKEEVGFKCRAYQGNVINYMNSVAIIESPEAEGNLYYMVVVISNVLRKNSAVEHQTLATRIHRLMKQAHPVKNASVKK
ncbi:serine hydrolase [sulfur-oxidizing endosymbiont of Gigantopelta aegis]|uniref:serine hydrolase n=1 Tax=sulfur-oxidizing endosymbiont of Gigantopelta aegis TaxID=2794934 RepID=UPI001FE7CF48|nr:serine hydrolase [sulfur-oxidizing endosymbiont of Gigantopelta aegis]